MKTKHTPGPWYIVNHEGQIDSIRAKAWGHSDQMADYRGNIICDLTRAHGDRKHAFEETEANAKLIVAAPGMLQQLESDRMTMKVILEYAKSNKLDDWIDMLKQLLSIFKKQS